jgi:hypothetical protein
MATCPKDFLYFTQQMIKKVAINLNAIKDRGKVNIDLKLSKFLHFLDGMKTRRPTTRRPDNWSTGPNGDNWSTAKLIDPTHRSTD